MFSDVTGQNNGEIETFRINNERRKRFIINDKKRMRFRSAHRTKLNHEQRKI